MVLALLVAGCTGEKKSAPPVEPAATSRTDAHRAAMEGLIAFARSPGDTTWTAAPFAASVDLGLGDTLYSRRSARELREPAAWRLALELFRGRVGTYSALDLIAMEQGSLRVTHGPHRHCASPPVPPPPHVSTLERVVVQPRDPDGCLDWWTVDAFVDGDGKIRAITFDLWEP